MGSTRMSTHLTRSVDLLARSLFSCGYLALLIALGLCLCSTASAASYKDVYTFSTSGPYGLYANVVQGLDGAYYGTTSYGGTNGSGTVFRLMPGGAFKVIYSFCKLANCADGAEPSQPLLVGTDGNLYGTTLFGGTGTAQCGSGCGTVFKVTPAGILTTLHSFCTVSPCDDGASPSSGLIEGRSGGFYGVTSAAGGSYLQGTVYKITSSGTLTTVYAFCIQNGCADGETPRSGLVQGPNGHLYGTTDSGGQYGYGEIFELSLTGQILVVHSFDKTDGQGSFSPLLLGANGTFYGSAEYGGSTMCGANPCGTLYKMTPTGGFTTLVNFDGTNGSLPVGPLVQGIDGYIYGITNGGGTNSSGTFFRMGPAGKVATVFNFCTAPCTGGYYPDYGVIQGTNGLFYGIAGSGEDGGSVVYSINTGLGPLLLTVPLAAEVGASVRILGSNLAGATAVSFNGTSQPEFAVVSASEITTTVPEGATSGKIEVTTDGGTVVSTSAVFEIF